MADIRINSLPSTATSFNTDDYIAIDGASGGTRKMLAANPPFSDVTLGASGPSVKSTLSARAPRQGLVFDGTAGATVANVPAIGTGNFTVVAFANPTVGADRCILSGLGSSPAWYLLSTGYLRMNKLGVGTASDSTSTVPSGKFSMMCYTRSGTTGSHYINGVAAGSATDSFDYTTAITRIGTDSGNFWNSNLVVLIYNRALSASEVVALYEAGAPAGADYNNASNTAINTSAFTNNGTFGLNYSTFSGASATGFTAAQATATAGMGEMKPNLSAKVGKRYRVSFTATLTSGQAPTFQTQDGSGNQCFPQVTVTNGANSFEVTMNSFASGTLVTSFYTSNVTSYAISNFSMVPLGLLLAPDAAQAGGGLVWYDTSGNAANITLPASGVSWNVPSSGKTATGWTYGGDLTVAGTGTSTFGGWLKIDFGNPIFLLNESDQVANSKLWGLQSEGSQLKVRAFNDAMSSAVDAAVFTRTGNQLLGTTTDRSNRVHIAAAGPSYIGMGQLTSTYAGIVFGDVTLADSASGFNIAGNAANSNLVFNVNTGGSMNWRVGNANAFTLSSASNLLIGTTIDGGQKLQVSGTAYVSGDLTVGAKTGAQSTPDKLQMSSGYPNTSTPTNQQLKISLGYVSATQNYGFTTDSLARIWYHAGDTVGPTGGHVFATGGTTALTLDSSQNATFAGKVGIGGASNASVGLYLQSTLNSSTNYGITSAATFGAASNNIIGALYAKITTTAASFTVPSGIGLQIDTPTIGAASAITTNYGLKIENQTGGGTNYAIHTNGGYIRFGSLPTSSAGLPAGTVWNDAGTLKIA